MTQGGMLYLLVVLATFGAFSVGIGLMSLQQTKRDRHARASRGVQGLHAAE
jgi:hypothetical protein